MFIVTVIVSLALALALAGSALAKLTKQPMIIENIVGTIGFPEDRLWMLAALELAAAAGLAIGLFWAPLGMAAAVGVILYFIGALIGHVRVGDTKAASVVPPTVLLLGGVAALVLRSVTA